MLVAIAISCKAQLIQTVDDLKKLDSSKKEFNNKRLKTLLKEIKPEIKSVLANPQYGYITFFFDSLSAVMKSDYNVKTPASIRVYIKETFTWSNRGKYFYLWTKKDEEEYENLRIGLVKIYSKQ